MAIIGENFVRMATQAGSIVLLTLLVLVLCSLIVIFIYFQQLNKAYGKHKIIVWKRHKDQHGNEIPILVDTKERGRLRYDKKLKKWTFHLKNANAYIGEEESVNYDENRELDLPSVPYENGGKVIFIEKLGPRKYAVGKPFVINGTVEIRVSDADIAEAIRSYDMNVKTFGKQKNELIAFMLYMGLAILALIMIIVILNKFEGITKAAEMLQGIGAAPSQTVLSGAPG